MDLRGDPKGFHRDVEEVENGVQELLLFLLVSSSRLAGIVRASQSLELFMEESNRPKDVT